MHRLERVDGFSRYQIQKSLAVLAKHHLVAKDRNDVYYRRNVLVLYRALGNRDYHKKIYIPASALLTAKDWQDYLTGKMILAYASQVRSGKTARKAKCYMAHNHMGAVVIDRFQKRVKHSVDRGTGMANDMIARKFRVDPSTASRWRRRGERSGLYVVGRTFYPCNFQGELSSGQSKVKMTKTDLLRMQDYGLAGSRYRSIDGILYEEHPSQIIPV